MLGLGERASGSHWTRRSSYAVRHGLDERTDGIPTGNLIGRVTPPFARTLHAVLQAAHVSQVIAILLKSPQDDLAYQRTRRLAQVAATHDFANFRERESQALRGPHEPHAFDIKRNKQSITIRCVSRGADETSSRIEPHDMGFHPGSTCDVGHREKCVVGFAGAAYHVCLPSGMAVRGRLARKSTEAREKARRMRGVVAPPLTERFLRLPLLEES